MAKKDGFTGIFVHPKTIPNLTAGHYMLSTGKATGDKEDMVIMVRFEGMQKVLKGGEMGIISGETAEEVQRQAHKLLRLYDDLLARSVSSQDALMQVVKILHQERPQA